MGAAGDGKAILVQLHPQLPGQDLHPLRRRQPRGQYQQVEGGLLELAVLPGIAHHQFPRLLPLVHRRGHRPPVPHPRQPLHPLYIGLILLPRGPQVHVKDRHLQLRVQRLGQRHLLGRVHAAYRGAVARPTQVVPRPHAVHEPHPLRRRTVGGPRQAGHRRPRQTHHPLELQGRQHVVVYPVAVLSLHPGVKGGKARRQQHRPHPQRLVPRLHIQVDGPRGTGLHARPAPGAGRFVDHPGVGHRPQARGAVDGLLRRQPALVLVGSLFGTDPLTLAAPVAQLHVHVAGLVPHPRLEGPRLPVQPQQPAVGQQAHVLVQVALQGGAQRRLARQHQADAARVGGKGVVQQVHRAAHGRGAVHQDHSPAPLRQVHRSRHPGNAPAHHQYPVARLVRLSYHSMLQPRHPVAPATGSPVPSTAAWGPPGACPAPSSTAARRPGPSVP